MLWEEEQNDTRTTTDWIFENNNEPDSVVFTLTNALTYTRQLSKAINAHINPIRSSSTSPRKDATRKQPPTPETLLMAELTAQVWNEVAAATTAGSKLTKALGRTALQHVWNDLEGVQHLLSSSSTEAKVFVKLFAKLLFAPLPVYDDDGASSTSTSTTATATTTTMLSDAAVLVWGSPRVLAQRAAQRQQVAAQRIVQQQQNAVAAATTTASTPSLTIEELPDEPSDTDPDNTQPPVQQQHT